MKYLKRAQNAINDYNNMALIGWVCETYQSMHAIYPNFSRDTSEIRSARLMHLISYKNERYSVSGRLASITDFIERLFRYRIPDTLQLKQPLVLYRKSAHPNPPHRVLFPIFTSTTLAYNFAMNWGYNNVCCIYKIIAEPDINYFPASSMCDDPFQYEIILPPGELIVERTEVVNGITHIMGRYVAWTLDYWRKFISEAPLDLSETI